MFRNTKLDLQKKWLKKARETINDPERTSRKKIVLVTVGKSPGRGEGFQHSKHRSWCKIVTKRKAKKHVFFFLLLLVVPCSFLSCPSYLFLFCLRSRCDSNAAPCSILDIVRVCASSPYTILYLFYSWSPESPQFLFISWFRPHSLKKVFCMIFSFNNIVSLCFHVWLMPHFFVLPCV